MARLCHDPLAKLDDQTSLLGQRDEVGRRHHALGRMTPAQQSLDGSDTSRLVLDDRLIDELELITPDSLAKVVLQCVAAVGLGLELLIVDAEAAAAFVLRLVKREIGILQDLVATVPMPGCE